MFFSSDQINNQFHLVDEEFRHIVKVLRHKKGDFIKIIDGSGTVFTCRIASIFKNSLLASVISKENALQPPYNLSIAIAPTKQSSRFEWFLEKAVEIGIHSIIPIITKRSEKFRIKADRMQKIMVSAMKQSENTFMPEIHPITSYDEFLQKPFKDYQKFIAFVEESTSILSSKISGKNLLVAIGPEGGFTSDEVFDAKMVQFTPVSLGHNRLRTETAGVAVCQIVKTSFEFLDI
jgi:16S rRNA (uracil1498-N3)-methyltransferase